MLVCKPRDTPMEQNHCLAKVDCADYSVPEQYRHLVGRLVYLTITRLDLSYYVHILTHFMSQPKVDHWDAALWVFRYLKSSQDKVFC